MPNKELDTQKEEPTEKIDRYSLIENCVSEKPNDHRVKFVTTLDQLTYDIPRTRLLLNNGNKQVVFSSAIARHGIDGHKTVYASVQASSRETLVSFFETLIEVKNERKGRKVKLKDKFY